MAELGPSLLSFFVQEESSASPINVGIAIRCVMNNLSAQRLRLSKIIYRGAAIIPLSGSTLPTNFDARMKDGAVALVDPTVGCLRTICLRSMKPALTDTQLHREALT